MTRNMWEIGVEGHRFRLHLENEACAKQGCVPASEGEGPTEFEKELAALINKHSLENGSNTPDFMLAAFLRGSLDTYNQICQWRDKWFGFIMRPRDKEHTVTFSHTSAPDKDGLVHYDDNTFITKEALDKAIGESNQKIHDIIHIEGDAEWIAPRGRITQMEIKP